MDDGQPRPRQFPESLLVKQSCQIETLSWRVLDLDHRRQFLAMHGTRDILLFVGDGGATPNSCGGGVASKPAQASSGVPTRFFGISQR